jgi:predicted PurR-regulated permease PerM
LTHDNLTKRIIKYVLVLLLFIGIIYFSVQILNLILIIAVSILISFILKPLVRYVEFFKIQKPYAVLIVILSTLFLISFLVYYFIPIFSAQFENLLITLRDLKIQELLNKLDKYLTEIFPLLTPGELSQRLAKLIQTSVESFFADISIIVTEILIFAAFLVIVPFITFFILKDERELRLGFINLLPNRYYEMAYQVINKVDIEIGRFVRGWILDACFIGVAAAIGLYFLGLENFAMIGLISGIGHLIPYLGPIIGGVPALLVAFYQFGDFSMFVPITLLFILIYTIDNGLVQPYVFAKSVNMHPIVIIFLILIGGQLVGIAGMLLAVPVANVIRVAAKEIYHGYKNYKVVRS